MNHVAVVGGGWAGCAAALTLAEAGVKVSLFEASRTLGGRARAVELEGRTLDNGQHILLGAYEHTLRLIDRLHSGSAHAASIDVGLWRHPLALRQPPEFSLACPRLPAPLHMLVGLLTAQGLSWTEKSRAIRWAHDLLHQEAALDSLTVCQLTQSQPEKTKRLLWHPLCISALNTPPELASARVFRDVIRSAFGGRTRHSDLLLPRRDLTALLPSPAAARMVALGGTLHLSSRVMEVRTATDGIELMTRGTSRVFSHVILAVAPQHLSALAAHIPALVETSRAVTNYRYQPIATGYVQYDPAFRLGHPFHALADGPAQFVFDRGQSHGQAGMMAFVVSAAAGLDVHWLDQAESQLQRIANPGASQWRKRIVEKQATYSCEPGMVRPAVRTPHPRVFLAGDYTAGPYPATLESAVTSGVQSSTELLHDL
ncbi:MAG: FAD-dependent oxidoreductase [Thiobacillus sp.]|nr:FAD-dependent oxidoreductase [Thiobacillus sp.]